MHDIRYDEVHDEILVPVPYGQAILTFRGGADGQEGPIRILQGPKVGTIGSRVEVDPINNEIYIPKLMVSAAVPATTIKSAVMSSARIVMM